MVEGAGAGARWMELWAAAGRAGVGGPGTAEGLILPAAYQPPTQPNPATHLQRLVHEVAVQRAQHCLVAHNAHTLLLPLHLCGRGQGGAAVGRRLGGC